MMENPTELLMREILEKHDITLINSYLAKGANINEICSNGLTPLGAAAQTVNISLIKALLEHYNSYNLDFNACKPQYLNLHTSEQKRKKNIGYFVVCKDIEENEFGEGPTPDGMEALEWDMEVNETDFSTDDNGIEDSDSNMYRWYANILTRTSILLDCPDRDISRLDEYGQSVLHYAVNTRNVELVDCIMTMVGRDLSINQGDGCYFTPLHMAVANTDVEMTKWLLKRGTNVNAEGGRYRQSALHIAARNCSIQLISILVAAGGDINAIDVQQHSVLTCAVRNGCDDIVKYLIRKGARVNYEEPGEITALRLAIWANKTSMIKILLESGARIIPSHHLLHSAVTYCNLEVIKMLVDLGASLNTRNEAGQTPLMFACSRKQLTAARYLLSLGANVNVASHIDGKTPLHTCIECFRDPKSIYPFIELLISHGADTKATSYEGNALFYSLITENRHATKALIQHGADVNLRDERAYVDNLSIAKRHADLELVKLLVNAGFNLSDVTWDPQDLKADYPDRACIEFLVSVKTNPLNLREICRIAIRKKLGSKDLKSHISTLPLPTMLQRYLMLEIL